MLAAGPDLTITKTHSGNPTQGQTGFVYTITLRTPAVAHPVMTTSGYAPDGADGDRDQRLGLVVHASDTDLHARRRAGPGGSYPRIADGERGGKRAGECHQQRDRDECGDIDRGNNTASDPTSSRRLRRRSRPRDCQGPRWRCTGGPESASPTRYGQQCGVDAKRRHGHGDGLLPAKLTATAMTVPAGRARSARRRAARDPTGLRGAAYPPISLTTNIAGDAAATITNIATVSGGSDFNAANNTASDTDQGAARADPTKDPDVVGLVNAQIATAQRFSNTQISNFNERLEALHDENTGDHFGFNFGQPDQDQCYIPGTSLLRDPFDPKCQKASQYYRRSLRDRCIRVDADRPQEECAAAPPPRRARAISRSGPPVTSASAAPTRRHSAPASTSTPQA